jgi:hypothetical protein
MTATGKREAVGSGPVRGLPSLLCRTLLASRVGSVALGTSLDGASQPRREGVLARPEEGTSYPFVRRAYEV